MGKPKCEFCGGEYGSSISDRILTRTFTLGLIGGDKNPYRPFCSRDCRVANQQRAGAVASQQQAAAQRKAEEAQRKENEELTTKAQSFRELVVGRDISSWEGSCDRCNRVLIHPASSDYCEECGSRRTVELRLYGDGFKRIVCNCRACGCDPVLRRIPCQCGGEAKIGNVVVRYFQNPKKTSPSDPVGEFTDVVFSSPRNITGEDLKSDVGVGFGGSNKTSNRTPALLRWIGYFLLLAVSSPFTSKLGIESSGLQLIILLVITYIFVKVLHSFESRALRWFLFVITFILLVFNHPDSSSVSEIESQIEEPSEAAE